MAIAEKRLFNIVVIGSVIVLLGSVYIRNMLSVYDEAERVKLLAATAEFKRVVMQSHGWWLKSKQGYVAVRQIAAQGEDAAVSMQGESLFIAVNARGWPEGLRDKPSSACSDMLALAFNADTLEEYEDTVDVKSERDSDQFLLCKYIKDNVLWFTYYAGTGLVDVVSA
jgi:hypothetical protein